MVQEILTDTEIWKVASNEAIDLFGNEWQNKRKWWNDRLKALNCENDRQNMIGGHLDIKV